MSLSLLLKDYCRQQGFEVPHLAKITGLNLKQIAEIFRGRDWVEPEVAHRIQQRTQIPVTRFWSAYFNSLLLMVTEEPTVSLHAYSEEVKLMKNSERWQKKLRTRSVPYDFLHLDSKSKSALNDNDLPIRVQLVLALKKKGDKLGFWQVNDQKLKTFQEHTGLSKPRVQAILKSNRPQLSVDEFFSIHGALDLYRRPGFTRSYFASIITKYKLGVYLNMDKNSKAYEALLNRIY